MVRAALITGFGIGAKTSGTPYGWPLVTAQSRKLFSSAALLVLAGTIAQVNVQTGYAFG